MLHLFVFSMYSFLFSFSVLHMLKTMSPKKHIPKSHSFMGAKMKWKRKDVLLIESKKKIIIIIKAWSSEYNLLVWKYFKAWLELHNESSIEKWRHYRIKMTCRDGELQIFSVGQDFWWQSLPVFVIDNKLNITQTITSCIFSNWKNICLFHESSLLYKQNRIL